MSKGYLTDVVAGLLLQNPRLLFHGDINIQANVSIQYHGSELYDNYGAIQVYIWINTLLWSYKQLGVLFQFWQDWSNEGEVKITHESTSIWLSLKERYVIWMIQYMQLIDCIGIRMLWIAFAVMIDLNVFILLFFILFSRIIHRSWASSFNGQVLSTLQHKFISKGANWISALWTEASCLRGTYCALMKAIIVPLLLYEGDSPFLLFKDGDKDNQKDILQHLFCYSILATHSWLPKNFTRKKIFGRFW